MTRGERLFMFLFGVLILLGLYFDRSEILYVIAALSLFEGVTNFRMSSLLSSMLGENTPVPINENSRFSFDAIRAWRLVIGSAVLMSGVFFFDQLWFLAWFVGFAVAGAGISGVCPVFIMLKRMGFR
jgi:DNA helicase TIP49 (TBP-interacting protein)